MNNTDKYILLFLGFFVLTIGIFFGTDILKETNIKFQKSILINQAQTHFKDQVNNRKWNSQYGGVYAKPMAGQKPNPYLKDNILKTQDGQTLIKINPAWMTRQLSELLDRDKFHFRITSLKPINPKNKPDDFEIKALKYLEKTNVSEYYELTENKYFRYMGALVITSSCMSCHKHQGYKIGDVRGGISISLNAQNYYAIIDYIEDKVLLVRLIIFLLLSSITFLLYNQIKSNDKLQETVNTRTKEILTTKHLLQKILDADMSFLFLIDNKKVIYTNKTVLDFAGYSNIDDFNLHFGDISSKFEIVDDEDFLHPSNEDIYWIDYLYEEQNNRNLKVLIMHNGINMYFKPHVKKVKSSGKNLYLVSFDSITNEYNEIQALEEKASLDHLTKLFNRGKLDEVLTQEMKLANTVNTPLSIIFLDIDHFKKVNDTLGHEVGDIVLIELSQILKSLIRKGDFVARWGGEEFIITLQSTSKDEAGKLAQKIRQRVEENKFEQAGHITISLGVTQFINGEDKKSLIRRVDEALYDAKDSGRNKVVIN